MKCKTIHETAKNGKTYMFCNTEIVIINYIKIATYKTCSNLMLIGKSVLVKIQFFKIDI